MMSEIEHQGRIVEAEVTTSAPADKVWQAWTDPNRFVEWFADEIKGEYRLGGEVTWVFKRFDMEIPYKVVRFEAGRHLVLGPAAADSPFLLEVTLTPKKGATSVRLVNSGFSESSDFDDELRSVESGWLMALGILKYYVEEHFGEKRTSFFAVREAHYDYDELFSYYRDREKLARWLTVDGEIHREGAPVHLVLRDGRPVTGKVLVLTPREIAVSWDEIKGGLELKAFSLAPDKRAVCIRGWGWGLTSDEAHVLEGSMESALERLVAALQP